MKITKDLSLAPLFTFDVSKETPIFNWFHYKEGYSPGLIDYCLKGRGHSEVEKILDPFCGVGTTLLRSKQLGVSSIGADSSPLAVFVSRTKCADYSEEDVDAANGFIEKLELTAEPTIKWDFELFSPRAAFPRSNYDAILSIREQIENAELPVGSANLLLLALLSILPQCSIIKKDGGVLKIDKKKSAMPAKNTFRKRVKEMISDLQNVPAVGPIPEVYLGDARELKMIENESVGITITSPPYLNNIDYSKIYGLELSLLALDKSITKQTRSGSLRSFITSDSRVDEMPPEVGEIGDRIPIIGTYFSDLEKSMKEVYRVLKPGGEFHMNVTNSVIHKTHVLVDEVLAEIGERLGFESDVIIGAERIADVRPHKVKTRESIVVMRK
ncbi:MAG: hypothetical protein ABII22_02935 [Candidatus Micrarchaeota archaeon]